MSISLGDIFKWNLLRRGDSAAGGGGATSSDPLVLGSGARANGAGSVAAGLDAFASWGGTVAIGDGAYAESEGSVALGYRSEAKFRDVVVGPRAKAYGWQGGVAIGADVATYDGIVIGRDSKPSREVWDIGGTHISIGMNNSMQTFYDSTVVGNGEVANLEHSFMLSASNISAATKVRLALIAGYNLDGSYLAFQHVDQLTGQSTGRKISFPNLFRLLDQFGAEVFSAFESGSSSY